jgi:hypothetical protein
MADMAKRWTRVAERVGRAVGYKTKGSRAERLAAAAEELERERAQQEARAPSHFGEENERAGRRYLRP